jgi:Raf kinase inhibitor-like YbhB/YbcL family protein
VTSPAFSDGAAIPKEYTCFGKGTAPVIQWSGLPGDAGAVALVVDDPDAPHGDYVHWIVLDIPAESGALAADELPSPAKEADGSGGPGWHPPCPPSGTHHYRFTVYALPSSERSSVGGDASPVQIMGVLADQASAWGRLTGTVTASGSDSGGGY